jgi:hypothetical protein
MEEIENIEPQAGDTTEKDIDGKDSRCAYLEIRY